MEYSVLVKLNKKEIKMIELYNCDCLEFLHNKDMKERKYIMVTDPPFNIGYKYNSYKDNLSEDKYMDFLYDVFSSKSMPLVIIAYPERLYKISARINIFPNRVVSWVYNSNTGRQHRDIAFFNIKPDFSLIRQPYKNLNDKRIKERIARGCTGARLYDWWNINQVKNISKEKTEHPCQMPLEVMRNIIGILPSNYAIFDPFMGSGTTALACKEFDRDFIGCEIDKKYYDIAKERLR